MLLSRVGYEYFLIHIQTTRKEHILYALFQILQSRLVLRGKRDDFGVQMIPYFILRNHRFKIRFVEKRDGLVSAAFFHNVKIIFIQRRRAIHHIQNEIRVLNGFHGLLHADLFHQIIGIPDSGRIHNIQSNPMNPDLFLQSISRGSGNIRDNGPLLSRQHIHQRGFSGIGFSNNHGSDAFPQNRTLIRSIHQMLDFLYKTFHLYLKFFLISGEIIMFRII